MSSQVHIGKKARAIAFLKSAKEKNKIDILDNIKRIQYKSDLFPKNTLKAKILSDTTIINQNFATLKNRKRSHKKVKDIKTITIKLNSVKNKCPQ